MIKVKLDKMFWKRQLNRIRNIKLGKLFYNNRFAAIFSILVSFATWIIVSSNDRDIVPVIVSDIPVDIELSESAKQDGLRIFSGQNITARVEITGNRIIVGQVTKDDIQVTAPQAASTIMSPGNYTLELSAKKVGMLQDYNIVSDVKPSVITVMADRYREAEFDIEPNIDFTSKSGYFVGSTVLSTPKVKLSGPETEISKIKKVAVQSVVPGEISSTVTLKLPLIMYDAYGQPISSETITAGVSEIEATIPVLMQKEVEISPNFSGVPEGINVNRDMVRVAPSKLAIAGPDYVVSELEKIELDSIDFGGIGAEKNRFTLPINLPQNCKSLNNVYSAEVSINLAGFRERSVRVNNFEFLNLPEGKNAEVYNGGINVTILAPTHKVNLIKSSDIMASIDCSGVEFAGSTELPINFKIADHNDAWVYGKYSANVNIKD